MRRNVKKIAGKRMLKELRIKMLSKAIASVTVQRNKNPS